MFVHCCHCTDCQTQTGGAFAINALIERDRVEILEGAPIVVTLPTNSGRPHDVYRFSRCQTALWSDYGRRGVMVFVRVSTLARPHGVVPDVHIFTRSKLPWVHLPEGAPASTSITPPPGCGHPRASPAAKPCWGGKMKDATLSLLAAALAGQ